MKTQLRILRWLSLIVLALTAAGAMAQTSQSPTQSVCVGNEPYMVTPSAIPNTTYTWMITPGTPGVEWQINPVAGPGNEITVDWNIPGVYTLWVYTSANGCDGPPQSVEVTVNAGQPAGVTINSDPTTVCEGVAVNFVSTVTNGGTNPTYQWFNGATPIPGATSSTYTYIGVFPGATITCQVISNSPCGGGVPVISNSIDVTVTQTLPLSVAISTEDPLTICAGSLVNLSAAVTNGGSNPAYQWYNNGIPIAGATSDTYSYLGVVPGATITCVVSTTEDCITGSPATSNAISIIVKPVPTTTPIWHN